MIFSMDDTKAMALLDQLKLAHESQAVTINNLRLFLEKGIIDPSVAEELTKALDDGTDKIADIKILPEVQQDYSFNIAAEIILPELNTLTLKTPIWIPAETYRSDDMRELGLMLDSITIHYTPKDAPGNSL